MASSKTKKPAPPAPQPQQIAAASKTGEVQSLIRLARVITRIGAQGPFTVDLPLFAALQVANKGFRKGNVPVGTRVNTDTVRIGKREGLIFRLVPVDGLKRNGNEDVEFIEVSWTDLGNSVPELVTLAGERLDFSVSDLDAKIRKMIEANPSMHGIIEQGFLKAQEDEKNDLGDEALTENPLFGAFG